MGRIVWTEPALDDVREIVRFIARDSPRHAEQVAAEIIETTQRLPNEPRTGWRVPEFDEDLLRELMCYSYRIIYSIRDSTCFILAVVHGSRDLARLSHRRELNPP
jgi:plasmid stabilization system protein ParE